MDPRELNATEQKILSAAKDVFVEKGFDGARMQEIANKAGINKALMHYYFRSKDNLFNAIFKEAFYQFIPKLGENFQSDNPLMVKIEQFVLDYIELIKAKPHIPLFVLHELTRNQNFVEKMLIDNDNIPVNYWMESVIKAIEREEIIPVDPKHLLVNMVSMCVFPFIGQPILNVLIFNNDRSAFNDFVEERKVHIVEFIRNSITTKPKS